MKMTNELEQIMKRRLEKSNKSDDNRGSSNAVAFIPPASSIKQGGGVSSIDSVNQNYVSKKEDKCGLIPSEDNPTNKNMSISHKALKGKERLCNVVSCLGQSCPWTKSISSKEMLKWLRSELDELEKELEVLDSIKSRKVNGGDGDESLISQRLIQSLSSEMGDILFDALMLDMIVQR